MIKPIHSGLFSLAAASLLACSGLAIAQQAPTSKPAKVQTKTEAVSVQTTTLNDGKNTVEVRVVDGQVFVKVNGEQRSTRALDGDWAKFEVRSKDGEKVIATVLKNGKANGVMVLSGSPSKEAVQEYKQSLAEVEIQGDWVRGFRNVEGLEDIEELKELEFFLNKNLEGVFEGMGEFEFNEEIAADLLRNFEISIADDEDQMALLRFEPGQQPKSMIGITMNIETNENGEFVIVEEVMEGLPASKAGLKSGDRIIEIEKIGKANEENIRRITREYEPGQEVTIRILRDGDEIERVITLAPYAGNRLGRLEQPQGLGGQRFFTIERDAQRMAEINAAAERLQAEIAERRAQIEAIAEKMATSDNPEELAVKLRDAARKLEESVRKLNEQRVRQDIERGMAERLQSEGGGGVIIGRGERGARPYVLTIPRPATLPGVPSVPTPPAPGLERVAPDSQTIHRIETLEQRLDRLEESNQRIERMLEALMTQFGPRS